MLTESCVMFFLPSRAVLRAILREEYLTSAVRTKEGDKAGSNQPPARDPVQFKLELTPNYLISYLENTGSRSTRYVSMPHPNESSILPKFLEKSDPEVARPAFSTWPVQKTQPKAFEECTSIQIASNPPISVSRPLAVQNHNPAPDRDVCLVAIRWLVDLNRRAYLKCLWLRFLHRSCWESWSCNFRIAFLEKFWKDWALIWMGHGYISGGSVAGIFEVRN